MVVGVRGRVVAGVWVATAVVVLGVPSVVRAAGELSGGSGTVGVVESPEVVVPAVGSQFGGVPGVQDVPVGSAKRVAPVGSREVAAEGFVAGGSVEDVSQRSAVRQRFENPDGSVTDRFSLEPRFFRSGDGFKAIDTSLVVDRSKLAKRLGVGGSGLAVTSNWFTTRLGLLADGVTVGVGSSSVTMTPAAASGAAGAGESTVVGEPAGEVLPALTTDPVASADPVASGVPGVSGDPAGPLFGGVVGKGSAGFPVDTATYRDVWPGVDVRYRVTPSGLKEELVLKAATVPSSFSFTLSGAEVTGEVPVLEGDVPARYVGALGLSGKVGEQLMFAPPVVTGDGDGRIFPEAKPTLTGSGSAVSVAVDAAWLKSLPAEAFPVVLDPTITGRGGTGWTSFADVGASVSDSYVGNSCALAGCAGYNWRSIAKFTHSELYSNHVQAATLHVVAGASGAPAATLGLVGWASSFDYAGAANYVAGTSTAFPIGAGTSLVDVDITQTMADMAAIDSGNYALLGFAFFQGSGYFSLHRLGFSTLDVTYESDGQVANPGPVSGYRSHGRRPTLSASVGNVGGPTGVNVAFDVYCPGFAFSSGWLVNATPGAVVPWTLGQDLPWNAECSWYALGGNSSYQTVIGPFSIMAVSQPPATPVLDRSLDAAVVATPTVTLSAPGAISDPDGDAASLEYSVSTGSDGVSGRVVRSALLAANTSFTTPTSSLPDGVYYATVRAIDVTGAGSAWARPVKFRVVQRLGVQDKMAYDSTGPFNVNLASGNLVVSAGGPSFATLGGSAAVGFTYNSQAVLPMGVTSKFYADKNSNGVFDSGTDAKIADRVDPVASFNWSTSTGPMPAAVNPASFVAVVDGQFRNPTGSPVNVNFQAVPIDSTGTGNKVKLQVNGSSGPSTSVWSTATTSVSVPANSTVPVHVEFGKVAAVGSSGFRVMYSEGSGWADVPAARWLQTAPVLPGGWSATGPALGSAGYSRLSAGENQVTLTDDSGASHVWVSNGDGYSPPPDEDGTLRRLPTGFDYPDAAGTGVVHAPSGFELADDDGYLYQFGESGQLLSVTAASDAVNPGALRYIYTTPAGSDVQRLTQIKDVFGRVVDLTYKSPSSANCPTGGSSTQPPTYTLCQVSYTGFTRNSTGPASTTDLYFDANGNLAAVLNPGDTATGVIRPRTDFVYDSSGRMTAVRDAYTNDLVASSVFASANTPGTDPHWWTVGYGTGGTDGMVTQITAPEPSVGASRPQRSYTWNAASTYPGAKSVTRVAVAGSLNASGWTQQVDIDAAGRPVQSVDQGGVGVQTFWDTDIDKQDRVVKTIDHHYLADPAAGLQTTTVYDAADRPTDIYGPGAPFEFTGQTSATAPHAITAYDEGISGLAAKWFNNTTASGAAALYSTSSGTESWGTAAPSNTAFPGAVIGNDFSGTLTGQASFGSPTALGVRADAARMFVDDVKVGDTFGGAYRAAVSADGPLGYWRLGDPSGSTAAIDAASGVNGTYIGSTGLGATGALNQGGSADPDAAITVGGSGVSGEALKGVNVAMASGVTDPLNLTGDMAIEAWINPTSTAGYQMIADRSTTNGSAAAYELRLNAGRLEWCQVNSGGATIVTAVSALGTNTWTHVAASRVTSAGVTSIRLYANGVDITPPGAPSAPAVGAALPTDTTRVGHRGDGYVLSGKVDEVAIYPHGLSPARILSHYAAATSATPPELSTSNAWSQTVRDDAPAQWWRLGESSGNAVGDASSEGSSPGVYNSVALGAAGSIVGDLNTAASFNGSSSYIWLPDNTISRRALSIEMWFKANGPGVLFQQSNAASSKYTPALYVGTDNKLYGGLWGPSYGQAGLSAPGPVVGNGWHHVVLSSTGVSQTLYLDGVQVADRSGVPDVSDMAVTLVGTGYTAGWAATNGGWFPFNGTVDDVAVYSYPLSASRVGTHFKAAGLGAFTGSKRVRVDYQDLAGNAALQVVQGAPGASTAVSAGVLSPRYGLVTSSVDPDGKKTASEYTNPELGVKTADVQDPGGLNLRTVYTYEGASTANQLFRRQLTRSLPGVTGTGTVPVTYSYWGQGSGGFNTADNPCTTGTVESINQGGAVKSRTAVDPDGAGATAAQTSESRYFGDGLVAASRRNSESGWTCFTYDGRGRPLTVTVPAFGSSPQRVVTTNYRADPDGVGPVAASAEWSSVTDDATGGVAVSPILTKADWLGRTVSYTDALGRSTTTGYDQAGRVTATTGPSGYGTVTQTYDTAGRPTTASVNSQPIATAAYNTASGVATSVTYPSGAGNAGNGVTVTNGFDTRGRSTSLTWTGPGSTAIASNTVARSPAGRVIDESTDGTIGAGGDANTAGVNYAYDGAGRLVDAYVPGHRYSYNYTSPSGADCPTAGPVYASLTANRNSNPTSVIDQPLPSGTAITTKSCYDTADRVTSTTALSGAGSPVGTSIAYDSRGRTTTLGSDGYSYDQADRHTATTSNVSAARNVLLVVGAPGALTSQDVWLQTQLVAAGWAVTIGDDDTVTAASGSGRQLVVLSESVTQAGIGTKFTSVAVPLISAEPFVYDELGMTGTGTNQGGTSGSTETQVVVTAAGVQSGLGAGLSAGNTTVASSGVDLSWGKPNANATVAATIASDATKATVFAYPAGAAMVTGTAPAPRVGWAHYTGSPAPLNATAVALFNAAVAYAAPGAASTTVSYVRDATDRIIARNVNGALNACYSYTAGGDTPDQTLAPSGATCSTTVTETVRGLPGGASVTVRGSAATDVWSLSNIHGDTLAVVNGNGVKQGGTLAYSPDGQPCTGTADNSAGAFDNTWLGTYQRPFEHQNNLQPTIEMGARPYSLVTGRFLEIDPVETGSANDYEYGLGDPENNTDIDGRWVLGACVSGFGAGIAGVAFSGCVLRNMSSGRIAISGSFGIAAGAGGAIGVSVVFSTANDFRDLRGRSHCLGAAGKAGVGVSGDVCWGTARDGTRVVSFLGSALGVGAGGYYAVSRTGLTVLRRDSWEMSFARGIWNQLFKTRRRR